LEIFKNCLTAFAYFDLCIILSGPDEQKFLEASMAYVSGKPIMTDKEFDQLKLRLKVLSFYLYTVLGMGHRIGKVLK